MYTLKSNLKETIGTPWRTAKYVVLAGMLIAPLIGVLYSWMWGFLLFTVFTVTSNVIKGREYLIHNLRRIRVITNLRERLLTFGDNEFILRDIQNEYLWRGEPPNKEIEERLQQLERSRIEFSERMLKAITDLFADPIAKTNEKTGAN